jgi:5-methylcytosine-specific restriction endonuclease McrA
MEQILLVSVVLLLIVWWFTSTSKGRRSRIAAPSRLRAGRTVTEREPGTSSRRCDHRPADAGQPVVRVSDGVARVDLRGVMSKTTLAPRAEPPAGLAATTWRLLLHAFSGCCRYCGQPLGAKPQRDHRIPMARGGRNEAANVVPACSLCNLYKAVSTEDEYLMELHSRTGKSGWLPDEAKVALARIAALGVEERREVTLRRQVWGPSHPRGSFAAPRQAALIDPPAVNEYCHLHGEHWLDSQSSQRVAGVTYRTNEVQTVAARNRHWGGWGYLLPDPDNAHDRNAVMVVAKGRVLGFLPRGEQTAAADAGRALWPQGLLPVVRVWAWTDESHARTSVRVHLKTGHVISTF